MFDLLAIIFGAFFSTDLIICYFAGVAMLMFTGWWRGWHKVMTRQMADGLAATGMLFFLNSLFIALAYIGVGELGDLFGVWNVPTLPESLWAGLPIWLVAAIAVIAYDFMDYVNHRMMHLRWLWPIHAVHYSDHELNAFSTFRTHVLESFFMRGSYIVGLTWMGMPAEAAGVGAIYLTVHNMYVHMNVDIDHGPLNWLVASPRFHRWHHADEPKAYGKNLANVMPLWDMAFGTYYVPGRCDLSTSTEEVSHSDLGNLLTAPFLMWGRMLAKPGYAPSKDGANGVVMAPSEQTHAPSLLRPRDV